MRSPLRATIHELRWIIDVSRPRSWIYLFGPFFLGIIAGIRTTFFAHTSFFERMGSLEHIGNTIQFMLFNWFFVLFHEPHIALLLLGLFILLFGYFFLPANLLIYGVNDLYDAETDALNPNKNPDGVRVAMHRRSQLVAWIVILQIPWILAVLSIVSDDRNPLLPIVFCGALFVFLGIFYSALPIRAKARPCLDSLFNILYVMPGLIGFYLATGPFQLPFPWLPFLAGCCWFMAMHAYSAVPDIKIDLGANLQTIATKLGARLTLFVCLGLYVSATMLAFLAADTSALKLLIGSLGLIYVLMMCLALMEEKFTAISKHFSLVNTVAGACLCFGILLL